MTAPGTVANAVRSRLSSGDPFDLVGSGRTANRWAELTRIAREDVVVGRLVEAHVDADSILHEISNRRVSPKEWWGVWAAEPPRPRLDAVPTPDGWELNGAKAWCSGAGLCSQALVTARDGDQRNLYAVRLDQPGVGTDLRGWQTDGMRRSATGTVTFDRVRAVLVGTGEDYLQRAGFWHGAIGVAACWLGGAERVADTLRNAATGQRPLDTHALAHLGAVDAALAGARWSLAGAALEVETDPNDVVTARVRALQVRAVVEAAATLVTDRVGRALGPGPLCLEPDHIRAVSDLGVYLRQSHAERDLATLAATLHPRPSEPS